MGRLDKEQVFLIEQISLSDFKKWSSSTLKTFNNYIITMTNNTDKIKIYHECGVFIFVAYSKGCSGEFHVVLKDFQNLENLIPNILNVFRIAKC